MSKIKSGKCFDSDLKQIEDLDFFLMSSKDNIILEFNDNFYCFKRKSIIKDLTQNKITYYNFNYYFIDKFDIYITENDFKSLSYNEYRFYSLYPLKNLKKKETSSYRIYSFNKIQIKYLKNM